MVMPLIESPAGTVSYNGFTFNGSASSKVICRAIPDRANRTTIYVEYQLTVRAVVIPNNGEPNTDPRFNDLRNRLTARGQHLEFQSQGFGDFNINDPASGTVQDISYGPHPEILEATPYGQGQAWMIEWRCTTRIPQCIGAAYAGRPLAHNYELEISVDEHGYSTRTVAGYLEIPAQIQGATGISDTADAYWDQLFAGVPAIPGFQRTSTHKLSDDKRIMTYQIRDVELSPTGFMKGCTAWEGEQELIAQYGVKGFQRVSATYAVERGQPKSVALENFLALVDSRVQAGLDFQRPGQLIPVEFTCRDQLNGRKVFLSVTYPILVDSPLNLLAAGGFFAPIPDSDFNRWQGTIGDAQAARGSAQLVYDKSSDAIIDLCGGPMEASMRTSGQGTEEHTLRATLGFEATLPNPETSYIAYMIANRALGTANVDFQKPMTAELRASDYQQSELRTTDPDQIGQNPYDQYGNYDPQSPANPDIMEAQATADYYIELAGYAIRAGYPVPTPSLQFVGDVPAILVNTDVQAGTFQNQGIPIYWGQWKLLYRLPSQPQGAPTLTNPVLRTGY